jgi:hypothetical protein
MEAESFSPARARLKKRKREKEMKIRFNAHFSACKSNTWDTLEKRWDTLAQILAPALYLIKHCT